MRIEVPKIVNDNADDFLRLFSLIQNLPGESKSLVLDMSECEFVQPSGLVLLGGAALAAKARGVAVRCEWPRHDVAHKFLGKCCFREAFGGAPFEFRDNSIPFRIDSKGEPKEIVSYLRNEWIGRGWLNVSNPLAGAIVSRLYEVYDNAFSHSCSPVGTVTCGQHFPTKKKLTLTVADFGNGIPETVNRFVDAPMSDVDALRWAFTEGHTTRRGVGPCGLGLKLLRDFVAANRGRMYVYSNAARVEFSSHNTTFDRLSTPFCGTLFHIRLNCDETRYRLASEMPPPSDFLF